MNRQVMITLWLGLSALLGTASCTPPGLNDGAIGGKAAPTANLTTVRGSVLRNTLQCGGTITQATVQRIGPRQLPQRYRQMGDPSDRSTPPPIDFNRETVLLISMGQRPSGGYLLNYQEQPIRFDGTTLEIELLWQEPLPGYIQAQVITTPCLLLRIPNLPIAKVRVIDQEGKLHLETTL